MPKGTGVATYARSLSHCIGELGHPVDVIYGLDIAARADAALREVSFFDLLETGRARKPPKVPSAGWIGDMAHAAMGLRAFEIPLTGQTIAKNFAGRLPHYDRILNVRDLFGLAHRFFRDTGRFVRIRADRPPDIMHWTYPVPIRLAGSRNIYTIHDLVPLRLPTTTLDNKEVHLRLLRGCFRHAAQIATVSETSRRDILAFFPDLTPAFVTNTYQAVLQPARRAPDAEIAAILAGGFGLKPRGYFLFFGSIEPKKNVGRLLEAYFAAELDLPLIIVGAQAWKSDKELVLLRYRPTADQRVRQIDYLPAELLATLIRGARAVTFPSLYEGFGLPVVEAMALGTPVLTSREGSLPEIAGEAALLVDAYDPRCIAAGLRRLAQDDDFCACLSTRGLHQAARFGMAPYRDRISALYQSVLPALVSRPPYQTAA